MVFINFKKKESNIFKFFTQYVPEKVSAYHTGSEFSQHYYVCRAFFVLKEKNGVVRYVRKRISHGL